MAEYVDKSKRKEEFHNPGPDTDAVRKAAKALLGKLPKKVKGEKIAGISISLMFEHPHKKHDKDEQLGPDSPKREKYEDD